MTEEEDEWYADEEFYEGYLDWLDSLNEDTLERITKNIKEILEDMEKNE